MRIVKMSIWRFKKLCSSNKRLDDAKALSLCFWKYGHWKKEDKEVWLNTERNGMDQTMKLLMLID